MDQLSLLSADFNPPQRADIGGLLAAHGQTARSAAGTRISIYVYDEWRADALVTELAARDIAASIMTFGDTDQSRDYGRYLLRTDWQAQLGAVAEEWTRGAIKKPPADLVISAGMLRIWAIAAGHTSRLGYTLGLDRHAPDSFAPLAAACAQAGIEAAIIGAAGPRPVLRIAGRRRQSRLAELLGTPPATAPATAFPTQGIG